MNRKRGASEMCAGLDGTGSTDGDRENRQGDESDQAARSRKYMRIRVRATALLKHKLATTTFPRQQPTAPAARTGDGLMQASRSAARTSPPGSTKLSRADVADTIRRAALDEEHVASQCAALQYSKGFQSDDAELWRVLEEDLIRELEQEHLMLQEQYANMEQDTQEQLHESVDSELRMEEHRLRQAEDGSAKETPCVLCPICQQSYLLQLRSIIFCGCGMRIDTQQDQINLHHVSHVLRASLSEHYNAGCMGRPTFAVRQLFGGVSNLFMECSTCQRLSAII